ncbi:hypothetical protein PO909_004128 [Leuciscus waleckii]
MTSPVSGAVCAARTEGEQILVQGGVTYRDEPWHKECFLCSGCKVQLAGQPFTTQGEDPFCVKCFSNLYAQTCDKPITGSCDEDWSNDGETPGPIKAVLWGLWFHLVS